jgi:hypothetical protein
MKLLFESVFKAALAGTGIKNETTGIYFGNKRFDKSVDAGRNRINDSFEATGNIFVKKFMQVYFTMQSSTSEMVQHFFI